MKHCHKTVTKELEFSTTKKKNTTSMTSTCNKENKTNYKKYSSTSFHALPLYISTLKEGKEH